MDGDASKTCFECQGTMSPIVIMDRVHHAGAPPELQYRQPDDRRSFWTGWYPTAGRVQAYLCGECGRIALYGQPPPAEPSAAAEGEGG